MVGSATFDDGQVHDHHEKRDGEQPEGPPAAHFAGYRRLPGADVVFLRSSEVMPVSDA